MKQVARLHYLRIAPRKVRLLGDLVKGLPVDEAEAQLMYERRRAAKPILKLLRSAVSNAVTTKKLSKDSLVVENVQVDGGPMLKGRYLPRARGSATPIQRKMSHVTVTLALKEDLKPRYKIVVPKKTKTPPAEGKKPAAKKSVKETAEASTSAKKGESPFLKRVFRRKAV